MEKYTKMTLKEKFEEFVKLNEQVSTALIFDESAKAIELSYEIGMLEELIRQELN